jgi:hypothetical protein
VAVGNFAGSLAAERLAASSVWHPGVYFDRTNVVYHEALGGKNDADHLVNHTRGQDLG